MVAHLNPELNSPMQAPHRATDQLSKAWLRLLAVLVLLALILLPRAVPMSQLGTQSDEGVHLVAAARLAEGDVLYRDIFENRTPLVEAVLAAAFALLPRDVVIGRMLVLHATALAAAALCAMAAVRVAPCDKRGRRHEWARHAAPLIALCLFGLTPLAVFWGRFTMLEHWQAAASALAVLAAILAARDDHVSLWAASGALAGIAVLAKQTAATVVVAGALTLAVQWFIAPRSRKRHIRAGAAWLAGLLLPAVTFLAYLALSGSMADFLALFSLADRLAPLAQAGQKLETWFTWIGRQPGSPLAVAGLLIIIGQREWHLLPLPFWFLLESLALFAPPALDLGWGGYSHYAVPLALALAGLAAFGVQGLAMISNRSWRLLLSGLVLAAMILTLPPWWSDLNFVLRESEYPTASSEPEVRIGQSLAAVTDDAESILVLGNSIFYLRAGRLPDNRFFHYPEYLRDSPIGTLANHDIVATLRHPRTAAVAVSRMHLQERLSSEVRTTLNQYWLPVDLISYPYQNDVFLYLPKPPDDSPAVTGHLAEYVGGIRLLEAEPRWLPNDDLLVVLHWRAHHPPDRRMTVFVHLLDSAGRLVGQHDGQPVIGFRPTDNWQASETITDVHWIRMARPPEDKGLRLSIGLYLSDTGERVPLVDNGIESKTSYTIPLERQ